MSRHLRKIWTRVTARVRDLESVAVLQFAHHGKERRQDDSCCVERVIVATRKKKNPLLDWSLQEEEDRLVSVIIQLVLFK